MSINELLGGGILTVALYIIGNFIIRWDAQKKTIENNQHIKTINMLNSKIVTLENKIDALTTQIDQLQGSEIQKEKDLFTLSIIRNSYPFPFWIKDVNGKALFVSKAYRTEFGFNDRENLDDQMKQKFGEEIFNRFLEHDIQSAKCSKGYATYSDEVDGYLVTKWAEKVNDVVVAYLGYAVKI